MWRNEEGKEKLVGYLKENEFLYLVECCFIKVLLLDLIRIK